ncbi:ankyrin repeat-containing protein [Carex littledalei]|uniref:Ankyrin repeat-containing protein n=1 Tax=Carex littledalei TaxID=544730 RepID=A0A833VTC1_9POAL|nr:ankyrin repeat-containing protein [Carex littledalei]
MSNSSSLPSSSSASASSSFPPITPAPGDVQKFLEACRDGHLISFNGMFDINPEILLSTTPLRNNCLHIAAMLNYDDFIQGVYSKFNAYPRALSLFSGTNVDGETPLITALMAANDGFASSIITLCTQHGSNFEQGSFKLFNRMLLKVDRRGENALHHALRNGFIDIALELLTKEQRLSEQVINTGESPMFMAARKGYETVVQELLRIETSAHCGTISGSALHAAVRFDNTAIVNILLEKVPKLAECQDAMGMTPLQRAINHNNLEMVDILLNSNPKLAYIRNEKTTDTPFIMAAENGFVPIAKLIMKICPDAAYTPNKDGHSALHVAIKNEKSDFVNYILREPLLQRLINQADNTGSLPLHRAAEVCDPKLIRSLLTDEIDRHDQTAVNVGSYTAVHNVTVQTALSKTLKWIESFTLLSHLNPAGLRQFSKTRAKNSIKKKAIEEIKSRTEKYTSNTSLVAALLATITFAAAFTLPGGPTSDGYPLFASNRAFQAFLISDTIAMCCSLTVAFLCILTTWEDMDFLLNYRNTMRVLMWCAYEATGIAFGTGLYTVLMPHHNTVALPILVLCVILPPISILITYWHLLMLRLRLGSLYDGDLVTYI